MPFSSPLRRSALRCRSLSPLLPRRWHSRSSLRAAAPIVQRPSEGAAAIQQSIARIHEASQAPTLSPQDYRTLFDVMAQEITANGLAGSQTLVNIVKRAAGACGVEIRRDDVRFVLDVVSEADPWFDQGASSNLFAGRFRNFVVARCRGQGLNLTADELDLIEAWFAAAPAPSARVLRSTGGAGRPDHARCRRSSRPSAQPAPQADPRAERWWLDDDRGTQEARGQDMYAGGSDLADEFPRIIRTRLRG